MSVTKSCQVFRQFGAEVAHTNCHAGMRLVTMGAVRHTVLNGIHLSPLLPYLLTDLVAIQYTRSVSLCNAVVQCSAKRCAPEPPCDFKK